MTAINMSRRQALLGTAAMAGVTTLGAMPVPSVQAKAPLAKDQAPYFYRFTHGKMQATVVSDGISATPREASSARPRMRSPRC